jgi:hypothetical protein
MRSSVSDSGVRMVVWGRGVYVRGLCCCWLSPMLPNEEMAADGLDTPTASSPALGQRARASPRFTRRDPRRRGLPPEGRDGEEERDKKREESIIAEAQPKRLSSEPRLQN